MAGLIAMVTVLDIAGSFALTGLQDDEFQTFSMLARVAGIDQAGVTVASSGLLWVARLAAIGLLVCAIWLFRTKKRLDQSRSRPRLRP